MPSLRPSAAGRRLHPLAGAALLLLAACGMRQTYDVRGRVVGFGDDPRTVIVEHEEIPGLMPAMTMPFKAASAGAVAALRQGEAVAFTLHVGRDSTWITDLARLPDSAVAAHPAGDPFAGGGAPPPPLLAPGDAVPTFTLVDAAGDTLRTDGYVGRVWLVTFIYTRCPLPEYCPLLSERFRQLQGPLADRFAGRAALLSVSFDPAYDTPAVLRDYARRQGADARHWTFATGDPAEVRRMAERFGVFYTDDGGVFTHNLTTALVGPDGRLRQLWKGNEWTVDEVLAAVANAVDPAS